MQGAGHYLNIHKPYHPVTQKKVSAFRISVVGGNLQILKDERLYVMKNTSQIISGQY